MKTQFYIYWFSFILISCGGVVGTLKKYELKTTEENLELAIQNVYNQYPTFVKIDTVLYGNDSNDFFFMLKDNDDTIVFRCNIIPPMAGIGTELSLTSATKYGDVLKVASKISYLNKMKYIRKFEKNILPKIKAEL